MESEPNFEQMVKHAQKKSTLRTIGIAFLVTLFTLLLLYGVIAFGQWRMYTKMDKQAAETMATYSIQGANISADSVLYDQFFVAGTTKVQITKMIDGTLFPWESIEYFHTILGTEAVIQPEGTVTINEQSIETNGHQEVSFQLPGTESKADDRERLAVLPDYMRVEVALSFEEPVPPQEVLQRYPEASWLWVPVTAKSSYFEDGMIAGREAYGFSVISPSSLDFQLDEFQSKIQSRQIQLVSQDIEVAGVVVTGTLEELRPYFDDSEITSIRAGVIIPY